MMDKYFFDFSAYLAEVLPVVDAHLAIKKSKYSQRIDCRVRGVEEVLGRYEWASAWVDASGREIKSRDWKSTKSSLGILSGKLRSAVAAEQSYDEQVLDIAVAVLRWGGNRDDKKGALPFLTQLAAERRLAGYLRQCSGDFDLSQTTVPVFGSVQQMNSMLTKVHAFMAHDGLPIYDSRVAASIATLAEQFRRKACLSHMPQSISFPTLMAGRHVRDVYEDAVGASTIIYRSPSDMSGRHLMAKQWSEAKWRLGKLMHAVFERAPDLFASEGQLHERCHALEASLFMLGSDPKALSCAV